MRPSTHGGYTIADEPRPSSVENFAVSPFFPLLGLMLGGHFLGFAWFTLNSFALGSSRRGRELAFVAAGFFGNIALMSGLGALVVTEVISKDTAFYLAQCLAAWKIGFGYPLYTSQHTAQQLIEVYGGRLKNGMLGVVALFLLNGWMQGWVAESTPWLRILFF